MLDNCKLTIGDIEIKIQLEIFMEPKYGVKILNISTNDGFENDSLKDMQPTDDLIHNHKIRDVLKEIALRLFNDTFYRNSLMYIDDIYAKELEIDDTITGQLYYLFFDVLEQYTEHDYFFDFGYKNVKGKLKYIKFKVAQLCYYNFNKDDFKDNIVKEMYLKAYSGFLDFAMEYEGELEDVEDKIREVFYSEKEDTYEIHKRFVQNKEETRKYIDKWFLLKSDYKSVDIILEGMKKHIVKEKGIGVLTNKLFNVYTWFLILMLPIISYFIDIPSQYKTLILLQNHIILFNHLFIIILIFYNHVKYNSDKRFDGIVYVLTRRYYPRLLGAIVAGHAILLLGDEVYKYIINLENLKVILITILALLMSWIYLYSKISNTVKDKKRALKRSIKVFFTGLCESYALIYFLNTFVVTNFLKGLLSGDAIYKNFPIDYYKDWIIPNNPILFDTIHHIKITVLFPALALMIGIFIQILWEEGEITKPL